LRKPSRDITEKWLVASAICGANSCLDDSPLGLVESAADGPAKVDRIGGRRPDPGFVAAIRRTKVEHVQGVA